MPSYFFARLLKVRRRKEGSRKYWFLAVRYAEILEHISGPKKKTD
jgi:hypothetical protein